MKSSIQRLFWLQGLVTYAPPNDRICRILEIFLYALLQLLSFPEPARPVSLLIRNLEIELLHLFQESSEVIGDPLEDSIALLFTGPQRISDRGRIRVFMVEHGNEDVFGILKDDRVGAVLL